jgi:glutathione S-transferase
VLKLYHAPRTRSVRIIWLLSAADVMMGFTLGAARLIGVLDDRYPNLTAYLARLEARPAFARAVGAE